MKCGGGTFHFAHPGAQKCDLGSLTDPYATETHPRRRILSRFACRPSDEPTLPQAIPTRRCAEGVFIHTRRGAVNRPLAVTWYATGVGSVCRIACRSRWASSERSLRFSHHTQKSVVGGRCSEKTAYTAEEINRTCTTRHLPHYVTSPGASMWRLTTTGAASASTPHCFTAGRSMHCHTGRTADDSVQRSTLLANGMHTSAAPPQPSGVPNALRGSGPWPSGLEIQFQSRHLPFSPIYHPLYAPDVPQHLLTQLVTLPPCEDARSGWRGARPGL